MAKAPEPLHRIDCRCIACKPPVPGIGRTRILITIAAAVLITGLPFIL
jgi:hypothetical protein